MTKKNGKRIRLDFGNLPLIETAVRATIDPVVPLTYSIVYDVRERLRDEFPELIEPRHFEARPGVRNPSLELSPAQLPGAVYIGHPNGVSISLQSQVIVARWVRPLGVAAPDYPRYDALRDALWRAADAFLATCAGVKPRISVVNMSYLNFLRIPHSEPVLREYFSEIAQVKAISDAELVRKVELSWRGPDALDVRFLLEQVSAKVAEETVEGYQLTTAAGIRVGESDDKRSCLETVHDKLQVFFQRLISKRAEKEWQLDVVRPD